MLSKLKGKPGLWPALLITAQRPENFLFTITSGNNACLNAHREQE
jgi:hypothetical protein